MSSAWCAAAGAAGNCRKSVKLAPESALAAAGFRLAAVMVLEYFPTASFGRVSLLRTNPSRARTRLDGLKIAPVDDSLMTQMHPAIHAGQRKNYALIACCSLIAQEIPGKKLLLCWPPLPACCVGYRVPYYNESDTVQRSDGGGGGHHRGDRDRDGVPNRGDRYPNNSYRD